MKQSKEQLAAARKARAAKFPAPAWGDHVVRYVRQRARAMIQDGSAAERAARAKSA